MVFQLDLKRLANKRNMPCQQCNAIRVENLLPEDLSKRPGRCELHKTLDSLKSSVSAGYLFCSHVNEQLNQNLSLARLAALKNTKIFLGAIPHYLSRKLDNMSAMSELLVYWQDGGYRGEIVPIAQFHLCLERSNLEKRTGQMYVGTSSLRTLI